MEQARVKAEKFLCGAAFCFYALVTTHKLTNAPLWYDETIEYWYSKVLIGNLPFNVGTTNMYQRIISTYQPPLYNVIMHFWLKISEGEWWFRFFGVVMGFIGMVALYKTVQRIGNGYIAALAVVFSSCVYRLAYYWQECAEYCLMLGALFWVIYFWFCLMEKPTGKTIIYFTVSAIIPVYSQYGAAFPVVAMAITAFIYVICLRDRRKTAIIIISYVSALVAAVLPLYFFFLKKQMIHQQSVKMSLKGISFSGGFFRDLIYNLRIVFQWNFSLYFSDMTVTILLLITLLMIVAVLILSRNKAVKLFTISNVITWLLYYFSVKLGLYAYGDFGNRYNLFLIPMWVILLFTTTIELCSILTGYLPKKNKIKAIYVGICVCFTLCYSYLSWTLKLQNNWSKENCRGAVNSWYNAGAFDSNTIIYYAAGGGFAYYVKQDSRYTDTTENNVKYMNFYRDKSEEEYREYVNSVYGSKWPDEIYIVASHSRDDLNTFVASVLAMGYEQENIFSDGAYLIRLTKTVE